MPLLSAHMSNRPSLTFFIRVDRLCWTCKSADHKNKTTRLVNNSWCPRAGYFADQGSRCSMPVMSSTSASTTTAYSTLEVQRTSNQLNGNARSRHKELPWKIIGQQMVTVLISATGGSVKYKLDFRKRDLAVNANAFKVLLFEKDSTGSRQTISVTGVPGHDPNIHLPEAMQLVLCWITTWRITSGSTYCPHFLPGQVRRGKEDAAFAAVHPWIVRKCDNDMLHIYACMRLFGHQGKYRQLLLDTIIDRPCQFVVSTLWQICGGSDEDRQVFVHLLRVHFQRFYYDRESLGCTHGL